MVEKRLGGLYSGKKGIGIPLIAIVAILGVCIFAIHYGETPDAGAGSQFEIDSLKYKILSSDDMTVEVIGHIGAPVTVTIPDTVTFEDETYKVISIGYSAFGYCKSLEAITCGKNLKTIRYESFKECINLETIDFGNVEKIGNYAFTHCVGIKKLVLPDTLERLESFTFNHCTEITSLTMPVTFFAGYTNGICPIDTEKINTLTLTKGSDGKGPKYKGIADYYNQTPWYNSDNFTTLIIEEGVVELGKGMFHSCKNLKSITFPKNIEKIGYEAFASCKSLGVVEIPRGASVGYGAFQNCSNLKELTIPVDVDTVINSDNPSFKGCVNLEKVTLTEGDKDMVYYGAINKSAWGLSQKFHTLVVEDGVKNINGYIFIGCKNLVNVTLPKSLERIGPSAFKDCTGIKNLVLPDNLKSLGRWSFSGCTGLKELTIPMSLDPIEDKKYPAFNKCGSIETVNFTLGRGTPFDYDDNSKTPWRISNNIKNVTFADDIEMIGMNTFKDCTWMTSLTLNNITKVSIGAFEGCTNLVEINLDRVDLFSYRALKGCKALKEITLSESMPYITDSVFADCESLTSLVIPDSVKSIGAEAFRGCSGIQNVTMGNALESIGKNAFSGCGALTSLVIPDSVDSLGTEAFSDCENLGKLTVPISLNTVVKNDRPAFKNCKMIETVTLTAGSGFGHEYGDNTYTPWHISEGSFKSLIVADGVKSIGKNTFKGCDNLGYIQFCDGLESIGKDAFKGFRFFDSDGVTELSIDAGQLKGLTFSGKKSAMVKQ